MTDVQSTCLATPGSPTWPSAATWSWPQAEVTDGLTAVSGLPVAVDLDDDGTVEVVFVSHGLSLADAVVRVVDGATGVTEATLDSIDVSGVATPLNISGYSGVAVGDLDGDGDAEICTLGLAGGELGEAVDVYCFDADGGNGLALGDSGVVSFLPAAPALADLDGDGEAEIIAAGRIYHLSGAVLDLDPGNVDTLPYAADVDMDGTAEVILGSSAYASDTALLYGVAGVPDGPTALGRLTADDRPQVVISSFGAVTVIDTFNGQERPGIEVDVPTTDAVGPPTLAEWTGDGKADIGVVTGNGAGTFRIYSGEDGGAVCSLAVDGLPAVAAVSAFDFDADGLSEAVLLGDALTIVDHDCRIVAELPMPGAPGPYSYAPLVDVDGDGRTDILAPAGDGGLVMFGDPDGSWSPSQPVWSQHAWTPVTLSADGSVPADPEWSWLRWNTFRGGAATSGPAHYAADLYLEGAGVCLVDCPSSLVTLHLFVGNRGPARTGPTTASFVADGEDRILVAVPALEPGEVVELTLDVDPDDWGMLVSLELDRDDRVAECDTTNNSLSQGPFPFERPDEDRDGFVDPFCAGDDCNDQDPTVYPGAPEVYDNGLDENCDGVDAPEPRRIWLQGGLGCSAAPSRSGTPGATFPGITFPGAAGLALAGLLLVRRRA